MKELEQVDCEIRRVTDLQVSVSGRLINTDEDEHGFSKHSQIYNNLDEHRGGFLNGTTYAWLYSDSHLIVVNVKTGESISSWNFSQKITSISQFPTQSGESPLILVGLDNGANKIRDSTGLVCIFDCATSRVLRAIRMPVGVDQVCVVSGGAEWEEFNEKRPDNALNQMTGIACVILRNLHHIVIDLQRPLWDGRESLCVMDETSPADIEFSSAKAFHLKNELSNGKHTGYHLLNDRIEKYIGFNRDKFELSSMPNDKLTSAVVSSTKIGCLISGCLGRIVIWQNDGSIGWISPHISENAVITHLDLLEPTDDPRPFYYLWVVLQDNLLRTAPILRMYALLFERKYCEKGTNLYFNLEAEPSLKFEFELDGGDRVISLSTIERETSPEQTDSVIKRGEDSLLLISTTERTYLFDLNQWYKEQMPQTIFECQNPNSILANYNMKSPTRNTATNQVISCSYVSSSLREFPNNYPNSTEELFYPNSLSLEWAELSLTKLTFWMTRGVQAELLREMAIAGPIILLQPAETFHRCLSVGLVPFNTECSFTSDQNVQREMLLSLCLEQRWATFLVRCAKEWSDGSASYLYPTFLKWGVQRAFSIKMIADRLCIPLFDQSGSNIGEAEVRTLRFCSQQLECLSNVVAKIPLDSGDLMKQRQALRRVSTYFQVLLWFYDVGLLPETQELEEGVLPISLALKVPYPFEKLTMLYKEKREQFKNSNLGLDRNEHGLFIDELMTRQCSGMKAQWEREGGDTNASSYYPPPSLQTLLRSYLIDCHENEGNEIACKHQITIYLLMDLAALLPESYPGVDQLIKYPSAFKMSPSLIKLTQAFWLLDHEDYQGFLDTMTGQLVSDYDVMDWHHRLVLRTLVRNNQHKLALMYLRIRKPPLSSVEEQGTVIQLSVEHGLVQSAFHRRPPSHYAQLLVCFFQACKTYGKLNDILHLALDSEEEEVFVKFLKEDKFKDVQLLYYLQRCRYTEAINGDSFGDYKMNLQKNLQPTSFTMLLQAYNATLPDVTKRFSVNMARTNADADLEPKYPRPMSHHRGKKLQGVHGTVIQKAKETFLRTEKCQIPFISAPCTSLKANDNNSSMNCVLFPTLAYGNRNKRTLDQVFENEYENTDGSDGIKRRKLSDGMEATHSSDVKASGLNIMFDSPLVKRKNNLSTRKSNFSETPHSILKIRQLMKESTSPSVAAICMTEQDVDSSEKEKKVNRQIRFSIEQSNKLAAHQSINDTEDEIENKTDTTRESVDVFFSPNTSTKSPNDTSVLSDSSCSGKNIYHPRPRPSLRRSLQSSKESLNDQEISVKDADATTSFQSSLRGTLLDSHNTSLGSVERSKQSTSITLRTPNKRNSLLSASIYSTSVLSSDSSFEMSILRKTSDASINQYPAEIPAEEESNYNLANPVSPVSITKTTIIEKSEQIDSDEMVDVGEHSKPSSIDMEHNDAIVETIQEDDRDFFVETENVKKNQDIDMIQSKSNKSVVEAFSSLKNESIIHTKCKVDTETVTILEDSAEESMNLIWKDDDDTEEAFASLSNSFEDEKQRDSSNTFSGKWSSNIQNNCKNGFQESTKVSLGNFDITDDESSNSTDALVQSLAKTTNSNKNSLPSVPISSFYDNCDITDDESNSSGDEKRFNTANAVSNLEPHITIIQPESSNTCQRNAKTGDNSGTSNENNAASYQRKSNSDEFEEKEKIHLIEPATVNEKPKSGVKGRNISVKNTADQSEQTATRMTRSRRISSAMNDISLPGTTYSPVKKPAVENVKRQRRANSLAKEVLSSSIRIIDDDVTGPINIEKATATPKKNQTRSSTSTLPEFTNVPYDTKDAGVRTPVRRSARRASSVQKEEVPVILKTIGRRDRTSSISSLTSEINDEETSKKTRSKKTSASKNANEADMEELAKNADSSVRAEDKEANKKTVRSKKSATSRNANETDSKELAGNADLSVLEANKETDKKTTKLKKILASKNGNEADSEELGKNADLSLLAEDEETGKKTLRSRKASTSKNANERNSERLEKNPSLSTLEEDEADSRLTRKRGSSVPSESVLSTSRTRRSTSVTKELVSAPSEVAEIRKTRSSASRMNEPLPSSPAANTRLRRSSIQSVPEELEEVVKMPLRERRASSVDPPQVELKKRTRNFRARSVLKDPIIEEPLETAESMEPKDVAEARKPTRRKRTASVSSSVKETEENTTTEKSGRKKVSSVSGEDKGQFVFSQPEKANDEPIDQKDIGQVPKYMFSPPQTRSKHVPNQHRRKLNAFMSLPTQEEEPSQVESKTSQNNSGSYTRVIFLKQDAHRKFTIPKISKNI